MKNTIMKKAIATTLTALALTAAVSSTVPVFASADYTLYDYDVPSRLPVAVDAVLYDLPDYSSDIYGYVDCGDYVSVTADVYTDDTYGEWLAIDTGNGDLAFLPDYYIDPDPIPVAETRTVSVAKGYLALRTAPAYDDSNEIGELYNGDVVELTGSYSGNYAYVYSYKYDAYGYVNANYIF